MREKWRPDKQSVSMSARTRGGGGAVDGKRTECSRQEVADGVTRRLRQPCYTGEAQHGWRQARRRVCEVRYREDPFDLKEPSIQSTPEEKNTTEIHPFQKP